MISCLAPRCLSSSVRLHHLRATRQLRAEREGSSREVAVLRADLDTCRAERDRLLEENGRLRQEAEAARSAGGSSLNQLEELSHTKANMEAQVTTRGLNTDLNFAPLSFDLANCARCPSRKRGVPPWRALSWPRCFSHPMRLGWSDEVQ